MGLAKSYSTRAVLIKFNLAGVKNASTLLNKLVHEC